LLVPDPSASLAERRPEGRGSAGTPCRAFACGLTSGSAKRVRRAVLFFDPAGYFAAFLAFFASLFSFIVIAGAFLASFLALRSFAMVVSPVDAFAVGITGEAASGFC